MNRPVRRSAVPRNPPQSGAPETLWDKLDQISASAALPKWRDVSPDLARNVKKYSVKQHLSGQPKK